VKKKLAEAVKVFSYGEVFKGRDSNFNVSFIPEAMGVDVFETCKVIGLPIERNPQHYVHKIALVGRPKRTPVVLGSGYIPYINKDEHEPETMAGMIGETGGW
jgi:hypothetical protein